MTDVVVLAARRTAVVPRGGAFRDLEAHDLAAPCIRAALTDAGATAADVDDVIFGNALAAGGNPARLAAAAAGLPERIPALTIDSQCCGGLDAVALAASRIAAGEADLIVAGGLESWSRAPRRSRRPRAPGEDFVDYDRPPFWPEPARDPDMIAAAARLAAELGIDRAAQEAFAVASHAAARASAPPPGLVTLADQNRDPFARRLTAALSARLPSLAGDAAHALTAATVAVEADAAAVVIVASAEKARALGAGRRLRILGGARLGGDPERPGLAPIAAARRLLARRGVAAADLAQVEIMEAFAVQAMAFVAALGLAPTVVNPLGGALARGHPIGASGAVLMVNLYHRLPPGRPGLAAIAAAGGLGSAVLVDTEVG